MKLSATAQTRHLKLLDPAPQGEMGMRVVVLIVGLVTTLLVVGVIVIIAKNSLSTNPQPTSNSRKPGPSPSRPSTPQPSPSAPPSPLLKDPLEDLKKKNIPNPMTPVSARTHRPIGCDDSDLEPRVLFPPNPDPHNDGLTPLKQMQEAHTPKKTPIPSRVDDLTEETLEALISEICDGLLEEIANDLPHQNMTVEEVAEELALEKYQKKLNDLQQTVRATLILDAHLRKNGKLRMGGAATSPTSTPIHDYMSKQTPRTKSRAALQNLLVDSARAIRNVTSSLGDVSSPDK